MITRLQGGMVQVGTVYCIGRNVFAHALELGNKPPREPLIFLKSRAAIRALAEGPLAFPEETFHHEAEVVLVLGTAVPHGATVGWEVVEGVALGLDLTRRGVQNELKEHGLPWTTAKSFVGSAPLGPVVPLERFADPNAIRFSLTVNDELRQQGDLRQLTFDIPTLLTTLAALHPLEPGDLVFTGTPAGVGPIRRGDRFTLRFEEPELAFAGVL